MEKILTPEIILIALVMVAIVMGFFFMLVANKITAVDNKMSELTEGMDRRVNHSINTLSDQLHDDMVARSKVMENSLSQMGDTWRNSLNKTVEDMRSEIGKLQSELTHSNENLNRNLAENLAEHATDVNENIALVRDTHHQEVQAYHEQLANQVREHAVTEQATLHSTLNSISEAVKSNLTSLSENQSQKMLEVASEFTTGYTKINDQVNATIKSVTSAMESDLSSITTKVAKTISHFDKMAREDLTAVGNEVSSNLANISTKLDNSVSGITSSVTRNLDSLTSDINTKMLNSTEKLEQGLSDTATKLDTSIDTVTAKLDTGMSDTATKVDTQLTDLGEKLDTGLSDTATKVDTQLTDLSEKLDTGLSDTAAKVDTQLTDLSEKLDTGLSDTAAKVDTQLTDLSEKLDTDVSQINDSMRTGIENIGTSVTDNFDAIENKINKRIHKELQGLVDVFRGFSDKVDVIGETQDRIEKLAENVGVLSQALDDRRSRGNMGVVLVESIVTDNMSPRDYELNAELSNGKVVDCLLRLPQPSGNIAITTKIDISDLEVINSPLSSKRDLEQARSAFGDKLEKAIENTARECIIAGDTAEGAVLLLPSEAAFSEAHVNHRQLVDLGYRSQVWLASPSTLVAMITVARSVIKDANARKEMTEVHAELQIVVKDYQQLGQEVHRLTRDTEAVHDSATNTRKSVRNVGERLLAIHDKLSNSPELAHSGRRS